MYAYVEDKAPSTNCTCEMYVRLLTEKLLKILSTVLC